MEQKIVKNQEGGYTTFWKTMAEQMLALEELTKQSFRKKECRKCNNEVVEGTSLCEREFVE